MSNAVFGYFLTKKPQNGFAVLLFLSCSPFFGPFVKLTQKTNKTHKQKQGENNFHGNNNGSWQKLQIGYEKPQKRRRRQSIMMTMKSGKYKVEN